MKTFSFVLASHALVGILFSCHSALSLNDFDSSKTGHTNHQELRELAVLPQSSSSSGLLAAASECIQSYDLDLDYYPSSLSLGASSTFDKDDLPCCRGGISALKTIVRSQESLTLATMAALEDPNTGINDTCAIFDKPKESPTTVKFVDCDACFPFNNSLSASEITSCSASSTDVVTVPPGGTVCLLSVVQGGIVDLGAKMPTDVFLGFQSGDEVDFRVFKVHTSCSKPISPPYGIDLTTCDDEPFVDLTLTPANASSTILEFSDGLAVKDGVLFSDSECNAQGKVEKKTTKEENCCKGGASFLKMQFDGALPGILTFNSSLASKYDTCSDSHRRLKSKKGPGRGTSKSQKASASKIRFVDCNDDCVLDPLGGTPCSYFMDVLSVVPGEFVCIGVQDDQEQDNLLDFGSKLPTNLQVFLIPEDTSTNVFSATIHTSCSKPLTKPFLIQFSNDCSPQETPVVDMSEDELGDDPLLAFYDGISVGYYEGIQDYPMIGEIFNWTFAGCGCNEGPSSAPVFGSFPSAVDLGGDPPSSAPTGNPTSPIAAPVPGTASPTSFPTINPTSSPTSNPSTLSSATPTGLPTSGPTTQPSSQPSVAPTVAQATILPTGAPTMVPTLAPFVAPSPDVTSAPSCEPNPEGSSSDAPSCSQSPPSPLPTECNEGGCSWELPAAYEDNCLCRCAALVRNECVSIDSSGDFQVDPDCTLEKKPFLGHSLQGLRDHILLLIEAEEDRLVQRMSAEHAYHHELIDLYVKLLELVKHL